MQGTPSVYAWGVNANNPNIVPLAVHNRLLGLVQEKDKQAFQEGRRDSFEPGSSTFKMRIQSLILGLVATAIPSVSATALTYKLEANEKACFFAQVDQLDAKVAFYFAVSTLSLRAIWFFLSAISSLGWYTHYATCRIVELTRWMYRSNPAAPSMWITLLLDPVRRSF
jgi:hypothetical protein